MEITVKTPQNEYPIIIQEGLLEKVGDYIDSGNGTKGSNFVITNKTVHTLYGSFLEPIKPKFIFMEDGEEFKNFKTYENVINELLAQKIERADRVIALGGGVVGDIAGFVASTVLRGVDFIQIPTTLLAQVDSSVGGKTGINTQYGKNLVGTFYQPKMVLIDPKTLQTLDARQVKTGLAEVLKYAFIEKTAANDHTEASETFFNFLQNTQNNQADKNYEKIIAKSCQIKANVVSQDEKEKGLRAILNFGHTFGHAIERVAGYGEITHGEGVSMGIKCALKLALSKNLINGNYYKDALELLKKFELKTEIPENLDRKAIYDAMKSDKKVSDAKIALILPTAPHEVKRFVVGQTQDSQNGSHSSPGSQIDELSLKACLL